MRQLVPDLRLQQLERALSTSEEPWEDIFVKEAYNDCKDKIKDSVYVYAYDLASDSSDRDTLVAFFLSGATHQEIAISLRIPEHVVQVFERLVIDPNTFRNKLELLRYATEYKRDKATAQGRDLIDLGIIQGPYALIHHFQHGHDDLPIDTKVYAKNMLQQAYYFGMMSRGNQIRSAVAKEAYRWMNASVNLLKDYDSLLNDSRDTDEPILAIQKRQMTSNPTDIVEDPSEILH